MTLEGLLRASGLPWIEARMLAERAGGLTSVQVAARLREPASDLIRTTFSALASRRAGGEPIAYILGEREFFGRRFVVTSDVLIPRPETELLCEAVLERLSGSSYSGKMAVADLGCGSGAIAVTLACERPDWTLTALDVSAPALAIARENARRLCPTSSIKFLQSDWFAGLERQKFDAIVSNPPYIEDSDPHLQSGDLRFEPRHALSAGADGLACIRNIAAAAPGYLCASGWLLFEHGYAQAADVRRILDEHDFRDVVTLQDLAGLERISGGRRPI